VGNIAVILYRVGCNRKAPVEFLLFLARDTDAGVKISVASNLSTEENRHVILANDSSKAVRSVVARF
jgi:hypothetical protein